MPLSQPGLAFVRDLVYRRSAIVIEVGKEYLVESRLTPLARAEGFTSIDEMVSKMRLAPANCLAAKVVEAMTTNETSFFRDQTPFDALKSELLPALLKARARTRKLRIWSAACSTGQEACSIAMLIRESIPDVHSWDIRILGTDLASNIVARAKEGTFNQIEVNRGLPAPLLGKYFERKGTQWQVQKQIRDMLEYRQLNLADPWPGMQQFDIVFLRNVLIYFNLLTKQAILGRVRQVLLPDGYMFLGGAETTLRVDDWFERVQVGKAVFYRPGGQGAIK